jgi:hypothetical protein
MSVLGLPLKRFEAALYLTKIFAFFLFMAQLLLRVNILFLKAMSFGTFPPRVYREYATFLEEVAKDLDAAEKHYVLACRSAPEDASFLISLAIFLGETRGRVKDAERVFEQVT